MKLNLLPSHVARSQGSKGWFFFAIVFLAVCGFGAFYLMGLGNTAVEEARDRVALQEPRVRTAMGKSLMADTVMTRSIGLDRNIKLTTAMLAHNTVYVELYRDVMAAIPSFYRINSISAAPSGADTCTVNLTGVLLSSQDNADLNAALWRMPGVTGVSTSGFVDNRSFVPGLDINDQIATPIPPGSSNIPSDPEARLAAIVARAAGRSTQFEGTEFGTDASPKGAIPGWSSVNVVLQLEGRAIQTPNPRATIDQHQGTAIPPVGGGAPAGGSE